MSGRTAPAIVAQSMTTSYDRLVRRINAHIGEPSAQLARRCVVRRMDTDCEEDWEKVLDEIREADGVSFICHGEEVEFAWEKRDLND